jgi:hypothetical protein
MPLALRASAAPTPFTMNSRRDNIRVFPSSVDS